MEGLTDSHKKVYYTLKRYSDNYSEAQLNEAEDNLFGKENNKKRRILLEYQRITRKIKSNPYGYINSLETYFELENIIKIMTFDKTLFEEAYQKILILNVECNLSIRLFSGIPKMIKEYSYLIETNKKTK